MAVLPVAPWLGGTLLAVLVVALTVPAPAGRRPMARVRGSGLAGLRTGLVGLLVVAGLAALARFGPAGVTDNPVPALVVGLGWPLLFAGSAAFGLVHRPSAREQDVPGAPKDARPAVVAAALVVGYLALVTTPTDPRRLAAALAAYAVLALAVAIALGRDVLARVEAMGLLARWTALGPRLVRWHPPRGAAAVLAVVLGGTWAERAQRTAEWFELTPGRLEQLVLAAACVGVAGLGAVVLTAWSDGRAAPVLLPVTAAAVVAAVLRRALISAQLLWDQLGPGQPGVDPDVLGVVGGRLAALAVVTAGGAVAAVVLARRVGPGSARLPGTAVVLALTGVSGWLALTP